MSNVTESIYSSIYFTIPMADVCFLENKPDGSIFVVMKGSTWNSEFDSYNNAPYITPKEAKDFLRCWCGYRHELELDSLKEIEK